MATINELRDRIETLESKLKEAVEALELIWKMSLPDSFCHCDHTVGWICNKCAIDKTVTEALQKLKGGVE